MRVQVCVHRCVCVHVCVQYAQKEPSHHLSGVFYGQSAESLKHSIFLPENFKFKNLIMKNNS